MSFCSTSCTGLLSTYSSSAVTFSSTSGSSTTDSVTSPMCSKEGEVVGSGELLIGGGVSGVETAGGSIAANISSFRAALASISSCLAFLSAVKRSAIASALASSILVSNCSPRRTPIIASSTISIARFVSSLLDRHLLT